MEDRDGNRAVEGTLIGVAWLGGLYAASPLVGGFGVVDVAQWIVFHSPGWLAAVTVDILGFYAKPVLVLGVAVGIVLAAAFIRIGWHRLPTVNRIYPISMGVFATAVLVAITGPESTGRALLGIAVAVLPPYLVAVYLGGAAPPPGRRSFLRRAGSVAVGGVLSLGVLRAGLERVLEPEPRNGDGDEIGTGEPGNSTPESADGTISSGSPRAPSTVDIPWQQGEPLPGTVNQPRGDPSFSFGRMPDAVMRPEDHYVVDINVDAPMVESNKPDIDARDWLLDVDGAVSSEYSLTYGELLAHGASVEQTTTMVCVSNEVGGELIGTCHWTGVQLSDLVAEADPSDAAVNVVTHAADGYSEAIPIDLVEREDILIAYGMGRRTLSREHGFPVRLLIPGRYGMKMTKWIERIEIADEEHQSHYEARGWDGRGIVNTMSYIRGFERDGDRVSVGGVAFGGLETGVEEIDRVEVSVDGGETWNRAELERLLDVHAWRRWKYEFESPERTRYEFVSRAVLRDGTVQTSEETSPRPGGATGWHRITREI